MSLVSRANVVLINVDVHTNCLHVGGQSFSFSHHKCALFVACLVEATNRNQALSFQALLAKWQAMDQHAVPDRTSMRRIVSGVSTVFASIPLLGAKRLAFATRCKTVGPWTLQINKNERWTIQESMPIGMGAHAPTLSTCTESIQMLNIVDRITTADDLARLGNFQSAQTYLAEQFDAEGGECSPECMALIALRQIRFARLANDATVIQTALIASRWWIEKSPTQLKNYLLAEYGLIEARAQYHAAPVLFSTRFNGSRLEKQLSVADAPHLRAEWDQLQGLVMRRRMDALIEKGATRTEINLTAHRAIKLHESALYWTLATRNAYGTQSVVLNLAYLLQRAAQQGMPDGFEPALKAYRVAVNIAQLFEFPDDSGWDYIMFAELWLQEPQVRALVERDKLLWPSNRNPADSDYYTRLVELTHSIGDTDQMKYAQELQTAFRQLEKSKRTGSKQSS